MNNLQNDGFKLKFDSHTIKHLGIQLYSSFPPVIAELLSNSYDAEAKNVDIVINYEDKSVIIKDNGHGMSHDDLNHQFLIIGRNRRESKGGWSKNKKRKVTGKKGLGKLAVFGIADSIEVDSICDNYQNRFIMNYSEIENNTKGEYSPVAIIENKETQEPNGTTITIKKIKQNNITNINSLASSLSKRFSFYDATFKVTIKNQLNKEQICKVTKNIYFEKLKQDAQFFWEFPTNFSEIDFLGKDFLINANVTGEIITSKTPFKNKKDCGFIIFSRGKLSSENTFFQDRANDNFNSYVTGYFNIDFIDDDDNIDNIETARQGLLWANPGMENLKEYLNNLIKKIATEWRKKRKKEKKEKLSDTLDDEFYEGLSAVEEKSLRKIVDTLIENSLFEDDSTGLIEVVTSVKTAFSFQTFQNYIIEMDNSELTLENVKKIATDWELIEAKELAKIAKGRISAINKFSDYITSDASETKIMQPFLEKFPWILDPKINQFKREVTFSRILKENFPDDELEESNRRLDFLCNLVNGKLIIIELKRPSIKITEKEINQVIDYGIFVKEHSKEAIKNGVDVYLITDNYKIENDRIKIAIDSYEKSGTFYIKTYTDLLSQAKQYNQEYIDFYDKLTSKKND